VLELAYEHMNEPTLVRIEPDKMTVDRVRQVIYYPSNDEKPRLLVGLLKHMDPRRSMVFVNTRRAAEEIEGLLRSNGINAEAISGDVPQRKRLRMLRDFHEGTLAVLIGTDVASRGLHIPDVSHVFNYDLPQDPEDYVHRIGRTARAGTEGDAISFGCEEYVISLPDIEAYIGRKLPVAAVAIDMLPEIVSPAPLPRRHFGGGGGRGKPGGRGGSGGSRMGGGSRGGSGGGRGDRGDRHRSGGGGGGSGYSQSRPPAIQAPAAPAVAAAAPEASAHGTNGENAGENAHEAPPRKRRRRRRSKRSNSTTPGTPPAPEAT
jgi:ATP-dependent RNA helicase RhlB